MIRRFARIKYNAPVILTFTFLALLSYALSVFTNGLSTKLIFANYRTSFTDPLEYVRLFSYILGHANWEHLSGNFLIILMVGPMLEEKYGSRVLIRLILVTAFVGGAIHMFFFNDMLIGASGIVYMFIILSSFVNAREGEIPLTLLIVFCIFIGKEVYEGTVSADNISQMTHIIGGICGAFFAFTQKHVRNA